MNRIPRKLWAVLVLAALSLALVLANRMASPAVSYAEARAVVDQHCVACHSEHPTVPAFPIAPGGLVLDTADQMQRYAEVMRVRTVVKRDMPLLNKTHMTDGERAVLNGWVEGGARGP